MNINEIKKHLYNDNIDNAINYVKQITDEETLYVYANNYNWDNGFSIPTAILDNKSCSLSVALLIFHLADGLTYIEKKVTNPNLPEWSHFIGSLYERIVSNEFSTGKVSFAPELSKVQLFKIKKLLNESEQIFVNDIIGSDCNILL